MRIVSCLRSRPDSQTVFDTSRLRTHVERPSLKALTDTLFLNTFKALHYPPRPCISSLSPTYHQHKSSKMMSKFASNSSDRKGSGLLPDLEDLGEVLKACNPNQGRKPDQRQTPTGKDCHTCDHKASCGTAVQASKNLIGQRGSMPGEETQHTKDEEMTNPVRKLMQKQPKMRKQASKQEPKTVIVKTAPQAVGRASAKATEKTSALGIAEGPLNDADSEQGS